MRNLRGPFNEWLEWQDPDDKEIRTMVSRTLVKPCTSCNNNMLVVVVVVVSAGPIEVIIENINIVNGINF